ncbi:MAG TPA: SdrD B-like domain-containing protein [Sediminibacterium sp.]|nr:SdrD B-like domain-containing protein [Sediminibacterium sp.]
MNQLYATSTQRHFKKGFFSALFAALITAAPQLLHAQVSGIIYRDFNANGTKDNSAAYNEPGTGGVTVKAYNAAGILLATTSSAANGSYAFTALEIPAATKVRLEFSGWQSADFPSAFGTGNGTSVQFATAPATAAHFAINYPGDYIDNANARIILPSYANGDNQVSTGNWWDAKVADNTYAFNYGAAGTASVISDMGQTGAVWATAYHRKADKVFYAAFVKRHVSLGPLGINGIYVTTGARAVTNKTNTGNFVNLNAINPAFDAGSLPGRTFSPGNNDKTKANRDDMSGGNVFTEVGKKGIGGMAISEDGKYLYLINLHDRKLWRVEIGANGTAPTQASQIVSYNAFPVTAGNSTFRPFAVKFYRGAIYVGGVLDGVKPDNSAVDRSELKAVVLKVDAGVTPGTETFSTVLDAPLTYQRKANMNTGFGVNKNTNYIDPNGTIAAATLCQGAWHPWVRNFAELTVTGNSGTAIYPQPMFTAIEFDPADGSMIIGITDRTGHQTGNQNLSPAGATLYTGNAAGDILKAANNGSYTAFTLESNGNSGANTTAGAGNNEGPGGGEFYYTDRYQNGGVSDPMGIGNTANGANAGVSHEETSTGSLAVFPGKELIATAFDPIDNWYTGGVRYYSNTNGIAQNGKALYMGNDVSLFGKANGLGDLEIISAPAPIEIGNRVWFDTNGDGKQDADEQPIAGVSVQLVLGGTVVATAVTDPVGNYYFSSDANRTSTASAKYGLTQLQPNTDYIIRIPNAKGASVQTPLTGYDLTVANNGGMDANADERDSDGLMNADDAEIAVTTGVAGNNNHSYDFGFVTSGPVGGGSGGGVESKSLGDAIAIRTISRALNNEQGPVDYNKLERADNRSAARINNVGTQLKLADILPNKLSNNAYKSYISTPKDIISITNAKDILSIDFVKENISKAVAFGTQTAGEVYDHTKAICDRLKGYELTGMQQTQVKGVNMVQYNLKNNNGDIEYAMSFIIGAKNGRNSYTIQSNWLNRDYTIDEVMYNIQLWGGSPSLILEMAGDIISRLQAGMPVQEIRSNVGLPKTYITSGERVDENLSLTINNTLSATNGYFEIKDRANEQTTGTVTRTVPFTLAPNGISTVKISSGDLFESTISLYVNGMIQDEVFMADGAWGVNYNAATTSIKQFTVTNSRDTVPQNAFPVFRNASVSGSTPDYITVYKLLRGGGAPQDLTAFKSLKFTAAGNSTITITLVKESIAEWKNQYTLQLPVSSTPQNYALALSDFKSAGINTDIDPSDITSMVVAMSAASPGRNTAVELSLSNVSFSKEDVAYLRTLLARDVTPYPNPSTGLFYCKFKADKDYVLTLNITEAATGKLVMTKTVNATKGENSIPVELKNNSGQKLYVISLNGSNVNYKTTRIVLGKN